MNEYFLLIINLKVENSFQKYFHSFESRVLKISLPFFKTCDYINSEEIFAIKWHFSILHNLFIN
jgi:hypothetical protein